MRSLLQHWNRPEIITCRPHCRLFARQRRPSTSERCVYGRGSCSGIVCNEPTGQSRGQLAQRRVKHSHGTPFQQRHALRRGRIGADQFHDPRDDYKPLGGGRPSPCFTIALRVPRERRTLREPASARKCNADASATANDFPPPLVGPPGRR